MLKIILLVIIVIFFAMNMGASGIAPSFAAAYGGKLIKRKKAFLLFSIFVFIGAIVLGKNVSLTLGKDLLPKEILNLDAVLIILFSSTLSLFLANILKIPQSTSQVTVCSIVGVGLYIKHLYVRTLLLRIIPMWIILPLLAYLLTLYVYKKIYPPEHDNLHIYQKLFARHNKLKLSNLITGCYVAFAIGSNNVANAVGPLSGAGVINIFLGLILIAPLFGLGAIALGKGTLQTAGHEIVPLGLFSSTLVSFVTATLLIFASLLGVPQSLVQLNLFSIFAISSVKNGHRYTVDMHITKKTFIIWLVTPLLSLVVAYFLSYLFLGR